MVAETFHDLLQLLRKAFIKPSSKLVNEYCTAELHYGICIIADCASMLSLQLRLGLLSLFTSENLALYL